MARLSYPLLIVGVLFVGLVLFTIINGELRLPFGGGVLFAFGEEKQESGYVQPAGTVPVFACPIELPAFTKIERKHLLTADGLHTVPVVQDAIEANGLFPADVDGWLRLRGRVLKRSKSVNFAFSESDFLPKGTRPGPSAGIPPGKRGIWIDVEKVRGLNDLRAGDRLDLVAAEAVSSAKAADTAVLGNLIDPVLRARAMRAAATTAPSGAKARSWVLAREARVIAPVRRRETVARAGDRATFVEEIFIAMSPEEVTRFMQALALKVSIVAAPRSGQPEDESVSEIKDSVPDDPTEEMRRVLLGEGGEPSSLGMVEIIQGGKRKTVTVPRGKPTEQESNNR